MFIYNILVTLLKFGLRKINIHEKNIPFKESGTLLDIVRRGNGTQSSVLSTQLNSNT